MNNIAKTIVGILSKKVLLLGVLAIIITSCTKVDSPFSVEESDVKSFEDLNINVKYAESYDQTTITYSRHWPSSISTGLNKSLSDSDGEFMIDYEKVREVIGFDEDGYMSTSIEFLEGDSEMGMPEEAYENLKNTMPNPGMEHDPMVRIESTNGIERSYGKSGNILYEMEYDPEEFRVDVSYLESLNQSGDSSDVDASILNNSVRLESQGISFTLVNGFYAKYDIPANQDQEKEGIGLFQEVMDLRNGEVIASSIKSDDEKYLEIVERRYASINNQSVLSREIRYNFGVVNGTWGISTRTVTQRENIQVIKN